MSFANAWTLAADGDVDGLRKVLERLPQCINVNGWVYRKNKRYGFTHNAAGALILGTANTFAAPLLFYASLAGSPDAVRLLLSEGGDASASIRGVTALQVASLVQSEEARGEIIALLNNALRRAASPEEAALEDEALGRAGLLAEENASRSYLERCYAAGTVTIDAEIRGFGGEKTRIDFIFPVLGSFHSLRAIVEEHTRCRAVLSYIHLSSEAVIGSPQRRSRTSATRELTSRTMQDFLTQPRTADGQLFCIARPVTYALESPEGSHNRTRIARDLREFEQLSPENRTTQRIQNLRKQLDDEERTFHTADNFVQFHSRRFTAEEMERATERLYTYPMQRLMERRAEQDDDISMRIDRSATCPTGELPDSVQETVDRLYDNAMSREERLQELDEAHWAEVPQPPECGLEEEDMEEARARLTTDTRAATRARLEEKYYGAAERRLKKTISKEGQSNLVDSVYHKAVASRRRSLAQLDEQYDALKRRPKTKTIDDDTLKAMAARLSAPILRTAAPR